MRKVLLIGGIGLLSIIAIDLTLGPIINLNRDEGLLKIKWIEISSTECTGTLPTFCPEAEANLKQRSGCTDAQVRTRKARIKKGDLPWIGYAPWRRAAENGDDICIKVCVDASGAVKGSYAAAPCPEYCPDKKFNDRACQGN